VVVAVDKKSCNKLKMSDNPDRWPRSMHARLVDKLNAMGAGVIAFDFHFMESGPVEEDKAFAKSLENAKNVVLCDFIKTASLETLINDNEPQPPFQHQLVTTHKPISMLTNCAAATAPFILPGSSYQVRHYPMFIDIAGGAPSMPLVAFQLYSMPNRDDFIQFAHNMAPDNLLMKNVFSSKEGFPSTSMERTMANFHELVHQCPDYHTGLITNTLINKDSDSRRDHIRHSLFNIYHAQNNEQFINFYGPPGAITTIPYCKLVLPPGQKDINNPPLNLRDKAIFIGASNDLAIERRDGFHTAFSAPHTTDTSGVEIAATIFANLLENNSLIPLSTRNHILLLLFWGTLLGMTARLTSIRLGIPIIFQLCAIYLFFCVYLFQSLNIWLPLITPVVVLPPIALLCSAGLEYLRLFKQSKANETYKNDLYQARSIQRGMLPTGCPKTPGFQIAADCIPAGEVGGDFFDFHDAGSGKQGIVMGDVTGKNLSGALIASASQTVFKMLCEQQLDPGETLIMANNRIKNDILRTKGMFVAFLYAIIDCQHKVIKFSNGGQPPPLWLAADNQQCSLLDLDQGNFPLGIIEDVQYGDTTFTLSPGHALIFYTDGIIEAMNGANEMYGFKRFMNLIEKHSNLDTSGLLEKIIYDVGKFIGRQPVHDDITVIIIQADKYPEQIH
ncbi:MAG: SpoIIE family protein phosphatase, partial [Desulfobulbaceae bacterium]|nr:SpoIIE family protein phosphatase [Desulfobulbaceae bacterium]